MSKTGKLWLVFASAFISGMTVGATVIYFYMQAVEKRPGPVTRTPVMAKMRIMSHLTGNLNLTPEQKLQVEKILDKMTTELERIRREQFPVVAETIQGSFREIDDVLNDTQKEKFRVMRERMKKCRFMTRRQHPDGRQGCGAGKFGGNNDRRPSPFHPGMREGKIHQRPMPPGVRPPIDKGGVKNSSVK